ncbi:hypothetical protein HOLleu_42401 [Holothuria leucospilota]|uniref:Uncharacterized protein n=1 Tax=Holothuria leucospilota TaxID=206669 RepID=A0A9Q0YD19_HOLLE|nr:hypothetical protein HOLleu_42401 [Holothuria leucospilota]
MDNPKGEKVPSKERKGETGFRQFVVDLTESFTLPNAIEIATILDFPPAHIDRTERDTPDGHVFSRLLQEKGVISQRDISPLIDALTKAGLHGIADDLQESFTRNVLGNGLSPVNIPKFQSK